MSSPNTGHSSTTQVFYGIVLRFFDFIWSTIIIQLCAENFWEATLDCVFCVQEAPHSLQILASYLFGSGDSDGVIALDSTQGEARKQNVPNDDAPLSADVPEFLFVHPSVASSQELKKARRQIRLQMGVWRPPTFYFLPNENPPLWPQRSRGRTRSSHVSEATKNTVEVSPSSVSPIMDHSQVFPTVPPPMAIPANVSAARARQKVCVLDLDETLVHASVSTAGVGVAPSFSEAIPTVAGAELYHIWERPYLQLFLSTIARIYNVVVFTAAAPAYADPILDRIDPRHRIKRRYYRNDCTAMRVPTTPTTNGEAQCSNEATPSTEVQLVKNLAILGVPLNSVVLVDNTSTCFALNPDNGVVVKSYQPPRTSDDSDDALLGLIPILEALFYVGDVREILRLASRNSQR